MDDINGAPRVIVVGGGLAGLTAAVVAARAGARVTLCERAAALGGRAASERDGGFTLNLGPHALYLGGPAARVMRSLGVAVSGRRPASRGLRAWIGGRLVALPVGAWSLLGSGWLSLRERWEVAGFFARLPRLPAARLSGTTVQAWLRSHLHTPGARAMAASLVRVSTYCDDLDELCAGAALAQVQAALRSGVSYLDGGWQSLVDAFAAAARQAGVRVETGAAVQAIEPTAGAVRAVHLADGRRLEGDGVILATPPGAAARLLAGAEQAILRRWAGALLPSRAACLDLGLRRLPRPDRLFALGVDRPLYLSVHSATARLAPDGGAVVHVARYLARQDAEVAGAGSAYAHQAELEALMDAAQPGWRDEVVFRRFLPHMTVVHGLPRAASGGLGGRPGPAVPGARGLCVAGDWVGPEGMLAEAALASGQRAAEVLLGELRETPALVAGAARRSSETVSETVRSTSS
jgi:phytoene dehydrogenase-like protein